MHGIKQSEPDKSSYRPIATTVMPYPMKSVFASLNHFVLSQS